MFKSQVFKGLKAQAEVTIQHRAVVPNLEMGTF